jgi:hypothetical protein
MIASWVHVCALSSYNGEHLALHVLAHARASVGAPKMPRRVTELRVRLSILLTVGKSDKVFAGYEPRFCASIRTLPARTNITIGSKLPRLPLRDSPDRDTEQLSPKLQPTQLLSFAIPKLNARHTSEPTAAQEAKLFKPTESSIRSMVKRKNCIVFPTANGSNVISLAIGVHCYHEYIASSASCLKLVSNLSPSCGHRFKTFSSSGEFILVAPPCFAIHLQRFLERYCTG